MWQIERTKKILANKWDMKIVKLYIYNKEINFRKLYHNLNWLDILEPKLLTLQ